MKIISDANCLLHSYSHHRRPRSRTTTTTTTTTPPPLLPPLPSPLALPLLGSDTLAEPSMPTSARCTAASGLGKLEAVRLRSSAELDLRYHRVDRSPVFRRPLRAFSPHWGLVEGYCGHWVSYPPPRGCVRSINKVHFSPLDLGTEPLTRHTTQMPSSLQW